MDDQNWRRRWTAEWRTTRPVESSLFFGTLFGVVFAVLDARSIGGLVLSVVMGNLFFGPFTTWRSIRATRKRSADADPGQSGADEPIRGPQELADTAQETGSTRDLGRRSDDRRRRLLAAKVDIVTWAVGVPLLVTWHRIWWSLVIISLVLRVLANLWSTRSRLGTAFMDLVRLSGIVSNLHRAVVGPNLFAALVAVGFAYAISLTWPDVRRWRSDAGAA